MKCEDCNCFYHRRQKEKEMEKQKFQFESVEAFQIYDNQINSSTYNERLKRAIQYGYIRKSELETLVEEAEEIYDEAFDDKSTKYTALEMKQYHAIQALKKDHPEFKK